MTMLIATADLIMRNALKFKRDKLAKYFICQCEPYDFCDIVKSDASCCRAERIKWQEI